MKLKASVSFSQPKGDVYGCDVDIDKDYVEGNADSIFEYVSNELYKRTATCKVIELAENGILSWETIAREALQYMSEDDVADMANSCDWLE